MSLSFCLQLLGLLAWPQQIDLSATLSVCEAISERGTYNGRVVGIRGEVKAGGHGSYFVASSECKYQIVVKGVRWPNVIYLDFPNNRSREDDDHANFTVDWKTIEKAAEVVRGSRFQEGLDRLIATYVGRLVAVGDLEKRTNRPELGGTKLGFGPAGLDAPAKLLIKSVGNVVVERGSR